MEQRREKRRFSLVELVVILVVIGVPAGIFIPRFITTAVEQQHQRGCLDHLRQLTAAIQAYVQDNANRYPSDPWTTAILPQLSAGRTTFVCPADPAADKIAGCSYGFNGTLLRLDTTGVNEAQVDAPAEIPLLCDAAPSRLVNECGYIPGGGLLPEKRSVVPTARHHQGIGVSFCDGHVACLPHDKYNTDCADPLTKGFYESTAICLTSNPGGGLAASSVLPNDTFQFPMPSSESPTSIFGLYGEYCTMPLVISLAELWKTKGLQGNPSLEYMADPGFQGGRYISRYLSMPTSYLWGAASTNSMLPASAVPAVQQDGNQHNGTAIAHDAVVVIVSKQTRIAPNPVGGLTTLRNNSAPNNGWYCCNTATIAAWFTTNDGCSADRWQAYTYDTATSTLFTMYRYLHIPLPTAKRDRFTQAVVCTNDHTIICTNDNDMVDKVAYDPYGIGYCSSAFVDYDRVQPLGIADASCAGGQGYWPNADAAHRTCLPNPYPHGGPNAGLSPGAYRWPAPLMRTLYVFSRGDGDLLAKYAHLLEAGPLFKCSYW